MVETRLKVKMFGEEMEAVTWGSQVLRSVNKKKDEIRQLEKNL